MVRTLGRLKQCASTRLITTIISKVFAIFVGASTPSKPINRSNVPRCRRVSGRSSGARRVKGNSVMDLNRNRSVSATGPKQPGATFSNFIITVYHRVKTTLRLPCRLLMGRFATDCDTDETTLLRT